MEPLGPGHRGVQAGLRRLAVARRGRRQVAGARGRVRGRTPVQRAREGSAPRRGQLSALRLVTLLWLVVCLMRPMIHASVFSARDAIVPILVDASRSMGLADADGARRIDRARAMVERALLPSLSPRFHTEVLRFGDRVSPADASSVTATDRHTSLGAALQAVRDRYRGRAVAGIVLLTDGGDNGGADAAAGPGAGAPGDAMGIRPRSSTRGDQGATRAAREPA